MRQTGSDPGQGGLEADTGHPVWVAQGTHQGIRHCVLVGQIHTNWRTQSDSRKCVRTVTRYFVQPDRFPVQTLSRHAYGRRSEGARAFVFETV